MRQLTIGSAVQVEVPATSANLGPGFDCFGLALDWREQVELTVLDQGFRIDVSGEGADAIPRDETHLIIRSALVGLADLGVTRDRTSVALSQHDSARTGSRLLVGGHRRWIDRGGGPGRAAAGPGLAAAARHGHRRASGQCRGGHLRRVRAGVREPGNGLGRPRPDRSVDRGGGLHSRSTRSRPRRRAGCCPRRAACGCRGQFRPSRAAGHALAGDPERLYDATRDWLHQGYRESAMPRSYELVKSLRGQGFAAVISGAGPSVLVLGRHADLVALDDYRVRRIRAAAQRHRRRGSGCRGRRRSRTFIRVERNGTRSRRGASLLVPNGQ